MQTARTHKNASTTGADHSTQSLNDSILSILAYFDLFRYPLTLNEIKQFLDQPVITRALEQTVKKLESEQRVHKLGEFFSISNDQNMAEYRRTGNKRAEELLRRGEKIGRFLQRFPFVRAVGISGSLSKNFADEKADIDFFIITKANRLWIARSLMHVYKKFTYLTGRQNYYCMNYYIDETALSIEQRNIYTAIEVKTLLPISGMQTAEAFFKANSWADQFLPVCVIRSQNQTEKTSGWIKKLFEKIFDGKTGEKLDNWLMNFTADRWQRKEEHGKRNKKGLTMGLITGKHFARTDPEHFQDKLLAKYEAKLSLLLKRDNVIVANDPPGPF